MREEFLRPSELAHGPDILRPGTRNAHLGRGQVAFITTRYADAEGRRFFHRPASVGHERFITEPEVLKAMFGPCLDAIQEKVTSLHDEYTELKTESGGTRYEPTGGKKVVLDHFEVRRLAVEENLFGRFGTVRGMSVLMLWNRPEAWLDLLRLTVESLSVPENAVLTLGHTELGVVGDFLNGDGP